MPPCPFFRLRETLIFIFLSLQFSNIKSFCHTFLRNYNPYKVETRYTHGQRLDVSCILESDCCSAYSSLYLFIFLSLQFSNINIFITLFSGTMSPTKLKLGTHVDNSLMYRVYWNQIAATAFSSLYLFIFLSLQFSNINIFVALFSATVRPTKLILGTHMDNSLMYCVYQNQTAAAYSSLYFIFLFSPIFKH